MQNGLLIWRNIIAAISTVAAAVNIGIIIKYRHICNGDIAKLIFAMQSCFLIYCISILSFHEQITDKACQVDGYFMYFSLMCSYSFSILLQYKIYSFNTNRIFRVHRNILIVVLTWMLFYMYPTHLIAKCCTRKYQFSCSIPLKQMTVLAVFELIPQIVLTSVGIMMFLIVRKQYRELPRESITQQMKHMYIILFAPIINTTLILLSIIAKLVRITDRSIFFVGFLESLKYLMPILNLCGFIYYFIKSPGPYDGNRSVLRRFTGLPIISSNLLSHVEL